MLPSLSDLFGQDDGKDNNHHINNNQQQLTKSTSCLPNNMFVGQQQHVSTTFNDGNHHVHGMLKSNQQPNVHTSNVNACFDNSPTISPSASSTLDEIRNKRSYSNGSTNKPSAADILIGGSSNLKSNLPPATLHVTSSSSCNGNNYNNMMFAKSLPLSATTPPTNSNTNNITTMHGGSIPTRGEQQHEISNPNDAACLHVFDKIKPLTKTQPSFSSTITTTSIINSNQQHRHHNNNIHHHGGATTINNLSSLKKPMEASSITSNSNSNTSPPTITCGFNTSQQMYFSNPTSIVQYPIMPAGKFNQLHASNNLTSGGSVIENINLNQTPIHDNYQQTSSSTRNYMHYERNSPIILQNDIYNNGNVSSSSSTNNSTTNKNSSIKPNVNDPSTNVVKVSQNVTIPNQFENYQHHDVNASTHPVIKENHLNNIINGVFYEDSEYSKRKFEDATNSSRKKRKDENLMNQSSNNNSEMVINPPPAPNTMKPSNTINNNNTLNSSSTFKKTKPSETKQPLKSPTTVSDNSLGSSTNYTNNSLSTIPQNTIQFMNFSISDKSKIKFVNARHQQIGINDGAWTEKEHADFMRGLNECGRGRWREIAENYVLTRTRTQVASHARKYLETSPNSNKK